MGGRGVKGLWRGPVHKTEGEGGVEKATEGAPQRSCPLHHTSSHDTPPVVQHSSSLLTIWWQIPSRQLIYNALCFIEFGTKRNLQHYTPYHTLRTTPLITKTHTAPHTASAHTNNGGVTTTLHHLKQEHDGYTSPVDDRGIISQRPIWSLKRDRREVKIKNIKENILIPVDSEEQTEV